MSDVRAMQYVFHFRFDTLIGAVNRPNTAECQELHGHHVMHVQ